MSDITTTAERPLSLTDLLVLDNELAGTIADLEDAWYAFQYGTAQPSAAEAKAAPTHRMESLHYDLAAYVQRLRTVTSDIGRRT